MLYTLRRAVGYANAGAGDIGRAEDVWLHAQLVLNETAERYWRYGNVLAEKRNQVVREVGQELISASVATRCMPAGSIPTAATIAVNISPSARSGSSHWVAE